MNYLKKNRNVYLIGILVSVSYNLYYIFLLRDKNYGYLLYLDALLAAFFLIWSLADYLRYRKKENKKKELLTSEYLIYQEFEDSCDYEIMKHDINILQRQSGEQFDELCDLQDYIAGWCHEVKIPLAASLLMNEKTEDGTQRRAMKEQLEKINHQLNSVLSGCRAQSSLLDLQVRPVSLYECVSASLHNWQYFLIHNRFELQIQVEDRRIYTDKTWLVYVLDQLISNSVKYAAENPKLYIWSEEREGICKLYIEDNGEGISDSDIRRIFERGFTGKNQHNGKYKSTGMGLYMAKMVLDKLGHDIEAESEYESYTRFILTFTDNRNFFNL